jgi:hypothetical protein
MCSFFVSGAKQSPASPLPHRLDQSATGYSSAGCSPALPASASPAGFHAVPNSRNSQALLNSTTEHVWGIFDRRDNFSALDTQKSSCPNTGRRGTTIHVLGFGPLAGFEVIMSGRF